MAVNINGVDLMDEDGLDAVVGGMASGGTGRTGTVKFYNAKAGSGYIRSDDGDELFVHWTGLNVMNSSLNEGQKVRFDIIEGVHGSQAVNVVVL